MLANMTIISASADSEAIIVMSSVNNTVKPQINVNYLGSTPESPMVGQDFTVTYEIDPLPFYHNTSGKKEIVLVLDKSGSMKDDNKMTNLKTAAINFIDSLAATTEDKKTPKITDLKIGIVTFSDKGYIGSDLLEVTSDTTVNNTNKSTLKSIINNLKADGGTNTGDGLRKGAYLLDKSDKNANKTIIFMADGQPTYYTYSNVEKSEWVCRCNKWECGRESCNKENRCNKDHGRWLFPKYCEEKWQQVKEYYTELDNLNPNRGGTGGSDDDGKSLEYATTIGNIINQKKYNVFSIGYGLDNSGNNKMKAIHESMGGISSGENSTFFATDSGAIDAVFKKIADTLISSYTIGDVNLSLNLADSITAVGGFEVPNGNGGTIKIEPIVYNKNPNNQYTAQKQYIDITLKAENQGDLPILGEGCKISYIDIDGNKQEVPVGNGTITIRPFSVDEAEKLGVDFKGVPEGYLIGDTITGKVTFTHNNPANIRYEKAEFRLDNTLLPSNLTFTQGGSSKLDFGTVTSTVNRDYKLLIGDDAQINIDNEIEYTLKGDFAYNLIKGSKTTVQSGEKETKVKVKRGLVKVKVIDEAENDITEDTTLSIKIKDGEKVNGEFEDGYVKFNSLRSGDYIVAIENLPEGCQPQENGSSTILRVDYSDNVVEVEFRVNGISTSNSSEIISHGIYMDGNTNDIDKMLRESGEEGSINVIPNIPLSIGVIVDIKGIDTEVILTSNEGSINLNKIKSYKIDDNGLSISEGNSINGNTIKINEPQGSKCLIIYEYTPINNKRMKLNAEIISSKSKKILNLQTEQVSLPNLF